MSKETEKRAAYLAALFARRAPEETHGPAQIAADVENLRRNANILARLAVKACNEQLTTRDEARQERLRQGVERVARTYGLTAVCHGDPRGAVVVLWKPGQIDQANAAGDGFGGGWPVY